MVIEFYRNKSEVNRLNKVLENKISVTGHIVEACDLLNPVIEFSISVAGSNLTTFNYVYIPAFNRYYFITGFTVNNKILVVSLKCDVLMTYKTDILSSTAIITRSNAGNNYIADPLILATKKIDIQCQKIGTGFTKGEKFVVQIGG